jgi:hypothetical protein
MERQRQAAVIGNRGYAWTRQAQRRYSRRDAILLGASGVFGLVGAAMARSVFVELASPMTAAALPLGQATPSPAPAPIDVTPRDLATRILTEVPMTGETRDAIAAEAARFALFGAGTVVTVRSEWRAPDGGYGEATAGQIDLSEDLFADDPWSLARRDVELPAAFARSVFVNLAPHDDNGTQVRALGDYLTSVASMRTENGREEALAALNPYSYLGSGTRADEDVQRARTAMDDPAGLFALTTTTFLRFPAQLVSAVAAMASQTGSSPTMPGAEAGPVVIESPAKALTKRYLRAVTDLLTALVPNPDRRGDGYVKTQLDRAIPRFGLTRFDLGIRVP